MAFDFDPKLRLKIKLADIYKFSAKKGTQINYFSKSLKIYISLVAS